MDNSENDRNAALRQYAVLDTAPEEPFDRLTALAAELFDAPIALVSLIDTDRQWFKSRFGVEESQTPREWAFCDHAIRLNVGDTLVVEDATVDPRFSSNPLVTCESGIRFYAGAPLSTPSGHNFGTLCVIDRVPRARPSEASLGRLRTLARIVVDELELGRSRLAVAEQRRLLDLAEEMSGVGRWSIELPQNKVTWSDEVYRIHGVNRAEFSPNLNGAIAFYHPDDQKTVSAFVAKAIADQADFAFQLRLERPDGELRHVVCKATCQLSPLGETSAIFGVFQDVTEHVRALAETDQARRDAEEKARRAAVAEKAAGLGHWRVEFPDRTLTWSDQMYAIYGVELGSPLDIDAVMAMTHDDDHALTQDRLDRDLRGESVEDRPIIRIIRPDGAVRWVVGYTKIERNEAGEMTAFVGTLLDITRQTQADHRLAESEAKYRLLADNASDIVTEAGLDGRFRYVSPAVTMMTGFSADDVIGGMAIDFVHPDDRERVAEEIRTSILTPNSPQIEHRHICKDGRVIWVESRPTVARNPATGKAFAITDVLRDISKRKAMEVALEEAMAVAEAAVIVKSEFLSNMSHELRTPLTSILGFSSILAREPQLTEQGRRAADRVNSSSQTLLAIVNDILDFSKLESGQFEIEPRPTDIKSLLREAFELLEPQAAEKQLQLSFVASDDLPSALLVDSNRLRQIVLNLTSNGVKFTTTGGVTLRASYGREANRLRCEVIDTGPGIPFDRLNRLFRRFSQVDASTTRTFGGTGLGLAICKGLAEAMGGEIGVSSQEGQGACFWFELPCAVAAEGLDAQAAAQFAHPHRLEGLRILVADDSAINRELVRLMLARYDVELTDAANGEEAVRLANEAPFDLILMDVRMPGMDGPQAALKIRTGGGPNISIPILAFTAEMADRSSRSESRRLFDDHINKPIVPVELIDAVTRWALSSPVGASLAA
jgi:PAS domain S-box-containing protein